MSRPVIAIPTAEVASGPSEPPLWAMRASYARPILAAGGTPIFLPPVESLAELAPIMPAIDGVLLAGGADIDPKLYGAEPHPKLESIDAVRDHSECQLVAWAISQRLPILGICRGIQMVNIVAGGTLYQDLPSEAPSSIAHRSEPASYMALPGYGHALRLTGPGQLRQVVGEDQTWVTSMHHQAVQQLGKDLVGVATSHDGLIEALESADPDHWLVALQGHPEVMTETVPWAKELFAQFVAAARQ